MSTPESEDVGPDATATDARQSVYRQKNSHVNPAVGTGEVAEDIGVSLERTFELLCEDRDGIGHLDSKTVGTGGPEHTIWW